jgi:hypothetical protein
MARPPYSLLRRSPRQQLGVAFSATALLGAVVMVVMHQTVFSYAVAGAALAVPLVAIVIRMLPGDEINVDTDNGYASALLYPSDFGDIVAQARTEVIITSSAWPSTLIQSHELSNFLRRGGSVRVLFEQPWQRQQRQEASRLEHFALEQGFECRIINTKRQLPPTIMVDDASAFLQINPAESYEPLILRIQDQTIISRLRRELDSLWSRATNLTSDTD